MKTLKGKTQKYRRPDSKITKKRSGIVRKDVPFNIFVFNNREKVDHKKTMERLHLMRL